MMPPPLHHQNNNRTNLPMKLPRLRQSVCKHRMILQTILPHPSCDGVIGLSWIHFLIQAVILHINDRGSTWEFSGAKAKKSFGSTYATKIEANKTSRSTICATPKIGNFHFPSLSLNRPLQYYYRRITRACSRFWRRSYTGCSLARATALPKTRACHSRRR